MGPSGMKFISRFAAPHHFDTEEHLMACTPCTSSQLQLCRNVPRRVPRVLLPLCFSLREPLCP